MKKLTTILSQKSIPSFHNSSTKPLKSDPFSESHLLQPITNTHDNANQDSTLINMRVKTEYGPLKKHAR